MHGAPIHTAFDRLSRRDASGTIGRAWSNGACPGQTPGAAGPVVRAGQASRNPASRCTRRAQRAACASLAGWRAFPLTRSDLMQRIRTTVFACAALGALFSGSASAGIVTVTVHDDGTNSPTGGCTQRPGSSPWQFIAQASSTLANACWADSTSSLRLMSMIK